MRMHSSFIEPYSNELRAVFVPLAMSANFIASLSAAKWREIETLSVARFCSEPYRTASEIIHFPF
jgi:hypothetical protein